jgi:CTP:molybdopterin cytidylyltransferase MocA
LILAAGGGTRFGSTKQLADLRGRPLLAHALDAMLAALDDVYVVLGHRADEIRSAIDFGGARIVVADDWETGQAASLRAGVAAIDADAVAITLGDQPFITPAVIRAALDALPGYDAVRAFYDGKPGHPVVLSRPVMDAVASLRGDTGARELLRAFNVRRWDASALGDATDVDTPAELARAACDTGVCGGDVPPLIGRVLTGTGLTLDQAAKRLERGEALPQLTDVQRRIVEDYAT